MPVDYGSSFDKNEWFVILALIIGYTLTWIFRKRFSLKESILYTLYGVFLGMLLDKTISAQPFDFYDVNDSSAYEFTDLITYFMYGPFSFFIIYFYDKFKIKPRFSLIYIMIGALVSALMEILAVSVGVYHYKRDYGTYYSFPIYLVVLSLQIWLFTSIHRSKPASSAS